MRLPVEAAQRVLPLKQVQIAGNVLGVRIGHAIDRQAGLRRFQRQRKVPPGVLAHEETGNVLPAAEPAEKQLRLDLHPDGFDAALLTGEEDDHAAGDLLPDGLRQGHGIGVFFLEDIPGPVPPPHKAELRDEAASDQAQSDSDQGRQNADAAEGENNANQLSACGDGGDIAVADRGHGDKRVPDCVAEGGKAGISRSTLPVVQQTEQQQVERACADQYFGVLFHVHTLSTYSRKGFKCFHDTSIPL